MIVRVLTTLEDSQEYREWIQNAPGASLWQSLEWQGYEEALGRETRVYGLRNGSGGFSASALVVIDRTARPFGIGQALGLSTWDIPRGPLFTDPQAAEELLQGIVAAAQRARAISVYYSPPIPIGPAFVSEAQARRAALTVAWQATHSPRHEQPKATILLNLTLSDEALLAAMHQKCRYNIRLAEKHGVRIEASSDVGAFHHLIQETARRDDFTPPPRTHYEHFLRDLPGSFLLLAHAPKERIVDNAATPIAALFGVTWGTKGYYYYGASSSSHRALMAPYLLQFAAMRLCRARGCTTYDLLGIAPPPGSPCHPWAGVTRFKRQFGGSTVTFPPEQEVRLRPVMNTLLAWKRTMLG